MMTMQHQQHIQHVTDSICLKQPIQMQHPTIVHDEQYSQRNPPADPNAKDRVTVTANPSMTIIHGRVHVGDDATTSVRSWTPLKNVGVGSFGEVQLCDWHSPLPPNTQLSPMQCGAGARPEWAGKRLVAVKLTKKRWERGWAECKQLKELESLRRIPSHPNIIPLYDAFVLPDTKQLYFVFECMEGNLYQLIKSRRGRPLAGGLVASVYRQVVSGLAHIHASGYFHRDMKPENLLVTTTGLADYSPTSPLAPHPTALAPPDKDVMVIVKLADFGLARETDSKPPYTEYVSTRWYRAPEVLLRSTNYSNPVDMWALGTILAELINLKPIFPGQGEVDQVAKITEVLGDPSDAYGVDERGRVIGGGKWSRGIKMARSVGFQFKRTTPVPFRPLFDINVPTSLVDCIADLLRYDPELRLTAEQCKEHPYWKETEHSQRQAIAPFNPHHLPPSHPQTRRPTHIQVPPPDTNASSTSSNNSLRAAVAGMGIHGHRRHHSQSHFNSSVTPGGGGAPIPLPLMSPRTIPPSHSLSPTHIRPPFLISTEHRQQQTHISPSPSPNLLPQQISQVPGLFSPTTPSESNSPNPILGPEGMSAGQLQYLAAQQGHYASQYPYPHNGHYSHQQVSRSQSHPHLPQTSRSAGTVGGSASLYSVMPGTSKSGGAASGTSDLVDRLHLGEFGAVPPVPPLPREYAGGLGVERASMIATVGGGSELEHGSTTMEYEYGFDDPEGAMDISPNHSQMRFDHATTGSVGGGARPSASHAQPTGPPPQLSINTQNLHQPVQPQPPAQQQQGGGKFGFGSVFGKNKMKAIFGGHHHHQHVPEEPTMSISNTQTNSLKRTQSQTGSTGSLQELQGSLGIPHPSMSPPNPAATVPLNAAESKALKKMAEKARKDAEKAKRENQVRMARERSQAVLQKRNVEYKEAERLGVKKTELEWLGIEVQGQNQATVDREPLKKGKEKEDLVPSMIGPPSVHPPHPHHSHSHPYNHAHDLHRQLDGYHRKKARRRDADDDHSMSSNDVQSVSRMSTVSYSTVESDPGQGRGNRSMGVGMGTRGVYRATSVSNLRTSGAGPSGARFPTARSSTSLEQGFVKEFEEYGLGDGNGNGSTLMSPPMQMLSLNGRETSPALTDASGTSPRPAPNGGIYNRRNGHHFHHHPGSTFMNLPTLPPISSLHSPTYSNASLSPGGTGNGAGGGGGGVGSPMYELGGSVNPMFQVPSNQTMVNGGQAPGGHTLPPFSHIASLAEHHHSQPQSLPPIQHHHHPPTG